MVGFIEERVVRRRVAGGEVPFIPGGGSPSLSANESPLPDTTSPTYLILLTSLHMLPSVITITGLHQHFIDAEFLLLGSPALPTIIFPLSAPMLNTN